MSKITAQTKTKPSDTRTLSPQAQELIQVAKDKIKIANASGGKAREAVWAVYYHLINEDKFTQLEAGDIIRQEFSEFSDRTIRRALPKAAKHTEFANKEGDTVRLSQPTKQELSKKVKQQGDHIIWHERQLETERATVEKLRSGEEFKQLEKKCYKLEKEIEKIGKDRDELLIENQGLREEKQGLLSRIDVLEKVLGDSKNGKT